MKEKKINWEGFAVDFKFPKDIQKLFMYGQHPASQVSFDYLYQGLQKEIEIDNVKKIVNHTGDLEIYTYTIECQFDKQWNFFNILARGLVLCPSQKRIICFPFVKFFNFGETDYFIPDLPFTNTEKIDGSLGIIYFWNGDWRVNTRGSFCSEQSLWAKEFLDKNIDKSRLQKGFTYLAEIIYKENKIVIPYDYEGLVLLSIYDNCGFEFSTNCVQEIGKELGFYVPKTFSYDSVEELLELAKYMPYNEEGFVVMFSNGYRLKIKGDEYVRIHRLVSNVKPLCIWECMINGDNLDAIKKELPEEMLKDFDTIRNILQEKFDNAMKKITDAHERTKNLSDKELGLLLKNEEIGEDRIIRTMLFLVRKKNLIEEAMRPKSKARKQIFNLFKPCGNVLEGYVPTSAMNRFG